MLISELKGVGPKTLSLLKSLNINKSQDLLFHLPTRYQDKSKFTAINQLTVGDYYLCKAKIVKTEIKFTNRRSLLVWLENQTNILVLRFFYFSKAMQNYFVQGQEIEVYGEVRFYQNFFEMIHPETNIVNFSQKTLREDNLTAVYSTTKGLQQKIIRNLIKQVLDIKEIQKNILPESFIKEYGFESLTECLKLVHLPITNISSEKLKKARDYLAFEELVAHHFVLKKIKQKRKTENGIRVISQGILSKKCQENLSFKLTNAQKRVIDEIFQDLQAEYPMQRLLQGDVGSGKTLVALMSALYCIEAKIQCAIMVPTEILAEQHFVNITSIVANLGINCRLLISKLKTKEKDAVINDILTGRTNLIIGTHALIQDNIEFYNLGLVIIDEQHRFGVEQRAKLLNKNKNILVNQLVMTATPIPRTLAMSFYSFLDCSVIDELPPKRSEIKTSALLDVKRESVIKRLEEYCKKGRQAYWVCPLIDESEILQCQAANDTFEELQTKLKSLRIALVHSKVKDKNQIMQDFKDKKYDILVATTVIEVGVDVPNASLMIIDNSERLGLSQLHQLRGRVGRGEVKSNCVLLYKNPLSNNAKSRLKIMIQTNDGFKIAERDLQIRGPGELLGKQQTGEIKFRLADFSKDQNIIKKINILNLQLEKMCDFACQQELIIRWNLTDYYLQ